MSNDREIHDDFIRVTEGSNYTIQDELEQKARAFTVAFLAWSQTRDVMIDEATLNAAHVLCLHFAVRP